MASLIHLDGCLTSTGLVWWNADPETLGEELSGAYRFMAGTTTRSATGGKKVRVSDDVVLRTTTEDPGTHTHIYRHIHIHARTHTQHNTTARWVIVPVENLKGVRVDEGSRKEKRTLDLLGKVFFTLIDGSLVSFLFYHVLQHAQEVNNNGRMGRRLVPDSTPCTELGCHVAGCARQAR